MTMSHVRSPRIRSAVRQSNVEMRKRESGESAMPKPFPAEMIATASPRRELNHFVAVAVSGT